MSVSEAVIAQMRRAALLLSFAAACFALRAEGATGGDDAFAEYSVKAAYLLKFGGFVDWPANAFAGPDAPFVIGVLGEDPFGSVLDQIVGTHTVQGRPVVLKRFTRIDQVRGVNVLYVASSERDNLSAILAALNGKNVLTVSDEDMPGVAVNFVIDRGRVRFDIDLAQAERAGLKISSKLLTVAHNVKTS
jgi:hypothetical protein